MGQTSWWRGARGEWWVAGQGVLMAAVVLAPPAWRWDAGLSSWWRVAGGLLLLTGLGLAAVAMRELGASLSILPKPPSRATLVRSGLYARVRHPIYGGLIVAAVGWAVMRTSGLHLLLAGALALYIHGKALREEAHLLERFPEYAGYRARSKRLLPWIV